MQVKRGRRVAKNVTGRLGNECRAQPRPWQRTIGDPWSLPGAMQFTHLHHLIKTRSSMINWKRQFFIARGPMTRNASAVQSLNGPAAKGWIPGAARGGGSCTSSRPVKVNMLNRWCLDNRSGFTATEQTSDTANISPGRLFRTIKKISTSFNETIESPRPSNKYQFHFFISFGRSRRGVS